MTSITTTAAVTQRVSIWRGLFPLLLLVLAPSVRAAKRSIEFEFVPNQSGFSCNKNDNVVDCDPTGMLYGGCAFNEDIEDNTMVWCCYAGITLCWGYNSDCDIIGSKKTCRLGRDSWCCDPDLESCGTAKNTCVLKTEKFSNPIADPELYLHPSPTGLSALSTAVAVEGQLPDGVQPKPGSPNETEDVAVPPTTASESSTETLPAPSETPPSEEEKKDGGGGLSAGAAAGVGIGVTAVVALIAGIAGCWVYRRRQAQKVADMDAAWQQRFAGAGAGVAAAGAYPPYAYPPQQQQEKAQGEYELGGDESRHEIGGAEASKSGGVVGQSGEVLEHYGVRS